MRMTPVNFLDKLKLELSQVNSPQYFFQFWEFSGSVNEQALETSLQQSYADIPKLSEALIYSDGGYQYHPHDYMHTFICRRAAGHLMETLQNILENELQSIVKKSEYAPFILVKIEDEEAGRFIILQMVNHVFCDATSAYLFFESLIHHYQVCTRLACKAFQPILSPVDDKDFVSLVSGQQQHLLDEAKALQEQSSKSFFSAANVVHKIYKESTQNDVFFDYFSLPLRRLKPVDNTSVNSQVSALIAKAFLSLKGKDTQQQASISIAANVRPKGNRMFGNFVSAIPIQLNNGVWEDLAMDFQQQISDFKRNPQRLNASYSSLVTSFDSLVQNDILEVMRHVSLKYHFYISNYGLYRPCGKALDLFPGCSLVQAGGFNFPLQAHYGLIFTLVPFNDCVGISVACSPTVFSKKEIKLLKALILTMACGEGE